MKSLGGIIILEEAAFVYVFNASSAHYMPSSVLYRKCYKTSTDNVPQRKTKRKGAESITHVGK